MSDGDLKQPKELTAEEVRKSSFTTNGEFAKIKNLETSNKELFEATMKVAKQFISYKDETEKDSYVFDEKEFNKAADGILFNVGDKKDEYAAEEFCKKLNEVLNQYSADKHVDIGELLQGFKLSFEHDSNLNVQDFLNGKVKKKADDKKDDDTLVLSEGKVEGESKEEELHPWMKPIDEKLKKTHSSGKGCVAENGSDYVFATEKGKVQYEGPAKDSASNKDHNPKKVTLESTDYHFIRDVLAERQKNGGFKKVELKNIKTPEMAAMMVIAAAELGMEVVDNNENLKIKDLTAKLEANKASGNTNGYNTEQILGEFKKLDKFKELKKFETERGDVGQALVSAAQKLKNDNTPYKIVTNEAYESDNASGKNIFQEYQMLKEKASGKAEDSEEKLAAKDYYSKNIKPNILNDDGTYKDNALADYFKAQGRASAAYKNAITSYIDNGKPFDGKTKEERKNVVLGRIDEGAKTAKDNKKTQKIHAFNVMKKYAEKTR